MTFALFRLATSCVCKATQYSYSCTLNIIRAYIDFADHDEVIVKISVTPSSIQPWPSAGRILMGLL